jgi:hypothetical protein
MGPTDLHKRHDDLPLAYDEYEAPSPRIPMHNHWRAFAKLGDCPDSIADEPTSQG